MTRNLGEYSVKIVELHLFGHVKIYKNKSLFGKFKRHVGTVQIEDILVECYKMGIDLLDNPNKYIIMGDVAFDLFFKSNEAEVFDQQARKLFKETLWKEV